MNMYGIHHGFFFIKPMNVVKQTFDYYMDKEMESLIEDLKFFDYCNHLAACLTIITLESLIEQELNHNG